MRFINNLSFTAGVSHEYDDRFGREGAKIGDALAIRKPVKFTATSGATLSTQDVTETSVTLTLNTQKHTAFEFTSKDLTLSIDRFSERYLKSAAVALANAVDVSGLTLAYQSTFNVVGTPGTVPNTIKTYFQAGEKLDNMDCPLDDDRRLVISPKMQTEILDANKGLFNSTSEIGKQYTRGRMGRAAGFDWYLDQNVRTHTVGPLGGTPLVDGASQTGASLVTKSWTAAAAARLKKGDIFTIGSGTTGVYAVNPVSGDTLPDLQQFVVTQDLSSSAGGAVTITISPSIVTSGAYKTVSGSPADNATINVLGAANTNSPQGIAYHKEAFVFAMAPLQMPRDVHFGSRATDPQTGMSIRMLSFYDGTEDRFITRCDILYGWAARRPEWACRIAS